MGTYNFDFLAIISFWHHTQAEWVDCDGVLKLRSVGISSKGHNHSGNLRDGDLDLQVEHLPCCRRWRVFACEDECVMDY